MLSDLPYVDLVPILSQSDPALREQLLRRAIRVLIGAEPGQSGIDFINLYRHTPQILHPEIAPVPGFTGREPELAALKAALWNGGAAALTGSPAATALSGLGGVGKSVLAREYAWRERERYRGVWWLLAESRSTLLDGLIELGARFIPGLDTVPDREAAAHATLDFIAQTPAGKPWLLVYDNAENPAGIERLTPRAGAHVLVTSRWQDWHGRARELPLDVFSEAAALEFLMAQARGAAERPAETRAAAAQLAQDLGRLPLALAIARAHAWSMGWSFAQYRSHLAQMLERERTKGVDYPRSIAATFTLAIEKAKATAPEAERLLAIAAYLAPDRIPLAIVTADVMPEIEKGEAVAALAEVSLVTRETLDDGSPAISVHRLVQEVMRRQARRGGGGDRRARDAAGRGCLSQSTIRATCATGPPAAGSKPTPPPCWLSPPTPAKQPKRPAFCSINTRCTSRRARTTHKPSRFTAARWPSTRESFGPGHPDVAIRLEQSGAAASGHEPARRGRALDAPRAGHRRGKLRPRSSQCGQRPQQSGAAASGHEPSCRGRALDAPRARHRREELRPDHPKSPVP